MTRMIPAILLTACLIGQTRAEAAIVRADFAAHGKSARYLIGTNDPERQAEEFTALCYWLPHLSRAVVLDHQRPVLVPGTRAIYRIDIELLGWSYRAWMKLAQEYPYSDHHNPLYIRADWLLRITSDANESDAYYDLLYAGTTTPKSRADFLRVWGVRLSDADDIDAGTIIGPGMSGVANEHNFRMLRWSPTARGDFFETFDSANTAGKQNPFENLSPGTKFDPPAFKFDAGEQIVAMPKIDLATGIRGRTQAYLLTDGKGNRVDIAEGTIVTDHQRFLGISQIRTPGSCIGCHGHGLNGPRENYLRAAIAEGLEVTTKSKREQEFLDRFYLSQLGEIVTTANEQVAAFCQAACGCEPGDAAADWQRTIAGYAANVTLETAAFELYTTPDELRLAIAWYSDQQGPTPGIGQLANMAHGRAIDRASWELKDYSLAVKAMQVWRAK